MRQVIRCVWEHHGEDSLLHAIDYAGAFTRGPNRACAEGKMGEEIASYLEWSHGAPPDAWTVEVVQEKHYFMQNLIYYKPQIIHI